jgi:tetratricopeptide (TPR) repeat protein
MSELNKPLKKRALVAWVNEKIQNGTPRWPLYLRLSKMQSESDDMNEIQVLVDVMDSLEGEIVDRNLKGIELEKQGKEEQAISLYEANVADHFDGSHPYNRLRILYKSRGDYTNAIRVCEAYITNSGQDHKLCESFRAEIDKLKSKLSGS